MADAERIVNEVADKVRELVAEAEERATEIVREAEAEAQRIRERAEAEGRERLAEVRKALDDLQGKLGSGVEAEQPEIQPVPEREPATVPEHEPTTVPEPTPDPVPDPVPGPATVPEPTPEPTPDREPPPEEVPSSTATTAANGARSADAGAARLVAMNMALDGATREEIVAALAADYELEDADSLVDDVLARTAG